MRKLVILQIGGMNASIDERGSMIDREVDELQVRIPDFKHAIEHIELSKSRGSIERSIQFLGEHMSSDTNLIIACKSLGCVRLNKILQSDRGMSSILYYRRTEVLTVDGNGAVWWRWFGKYKSFKLPKELAESDKYTHTNIYQRNKPLYGAKWKDTNNIIINRFPDNSKVTHENIIMHPAIDNHLDMIAERIDK